MHIPTRRIELPFDTQVQGQWLDITDAVQIAVSNCGFESGLLNLWAKHTTSRVVRIPATESESNGFVGDYLNARARKSTARVLQQENEPALHQDLWDVLEAFGSQRRAYLHDDIGGARTVNVCEGECANGHSHAKALLIPASVTMQVEHGKLILGTWPRILLLECDRPRPRIVSVMMMGNFSQSAEVVVPQHQDHEYRPATV